MLQRMILVMVFDVWVESNVDSSPLTTTHSPTALLALSPSGSARVPYIMGTPCTRVCT